MPKASSKFKRVPASRPDLLEGLFVQVFNGVFALKEFDYKLEEQFVPKGRKMVSAGFEKVPAKNPFFGIVNPEDFAVAGPRDTGLKNRVGPLGNIHDENGFHREALGENLAFLIDGDIVPFEVVEGLTGKEGQKRARCPKLWIAHNGMAVTVRGREMKASFLCRQVKPNAISVDCGVVNLAEVGRGGRPAIAPTPLTMVAGL